MQRKFPGLSVVIAFCFFFIQYSCTKIDSTSLGGDLIPAVDNVHTFDTIISIDATQEVFTDTTRTVYTDYQVLGSITNDPLFGQTHGTVYLELKPPYFPFTFGNAGDTIDPVNIPGTGFDSAVLCLSVGGFYGDSTMPQKLSVHRLNVKTGNFTNDTAYFFNYQPDEDYGPSIGSTTVTPQNLKSWVKLNSGDSANYQIRIKLDDDFLRNVLVKNLDTSDGGAGTKIYRADSIFKDIIKGFAIVSDQLPGSNGLFYISDLNAYTRLEVHYRSRNRLVLDTAYSSLPFSQGLYASCSVSADANNITRDRVTGSPEYPNNIQPDALYLQSVPGTFAYLTIPALSTLSNRIVHRAEIIAEQIPGNPINSNILTVPPYLYLDLKDTTTDGKHKPVYYDLDPTSVYNPDNSAFPYPSLGVSTYFFGGNRQYKQDGLGNRIAYYNFNITRYVQNLLTRKWPNYKIRLYAPYILHYYKSRFKYPNGNLLVANGGIKIKAGNTANPAQGLRMRIIYSKL